MRISGSVAIVTGGARGFGKAFTEELLKRGARVSWKTNLWYKDREHLNFIPYTLYIIISTLFYHRKKDYWTILMCITEERQVPSSSILARLSRRKNPCSFRTNIVHVSVFLLKIKKNCFLNSSIRLELWSACNVEQLYNTNFFIIVTHWPILQSKTAAKQELKNF